MRPLRFRVSDYAASENDDDLAATSSEVVQSLVSAPLLHGHVPREPSWWQWYAFWTGDECLNC
jgi:hypothetical protein